MTDLKERLDAMMMEIIEETDHFVRIGSKFSSGRTSTLEELFAQCGLLVTRVYVAGVDYERKFDGSGHACVLLAYKGDAVMRTLTDRKSKLENQDGA